MMEYTPADTHSAPVLGPGLATGTVVAKIEEVFESLTDSLAARQPLVIPLRSRRSDNPMPVKFPATNKSQVKRFISLFLILHLIHEALVSGTVITKRNIYYQNTALFGTQTYVDKLIDDVAFTFGIGRDDLGVVAAGKGLIAGGLRLITNHGTVLNFSDHSNGILAPQPGAVSQIDLNNARWILVIEKEATFRGLATSRYYEVSSAGPGILITGKGYPDLATRQLLHMIHADSPDIPVYALVDFDPDGIKIMLTYQRGSRSLRHEENITVPRLTWLGPKGRDVLMQSSVPRSATSSQSSDNYDAGSQSSQLSLGSSQWSIISHSHSLASFGEKVCPLSRADRSTAVALLENLSDSEETELQREVQLMLILNIKAEIQAVDDSGNLTSWLDEKLSSTFDWDSDFWTDSFTA